MSHPSSAASASLRLRVVQFQPTKGRISQNLAAIAREVAAASGAADLLLLPETAVSGYFVEGAVEQVARSVVQIIEGLGIPPADAPDLVLGAYERGEDGVLYNSAFHLTPTGGRWMLVHRHRKMFLPTYGLFDEARFVKPGLVLESYPTRFGRMGMLICEEILHALPPTILSLDGAELLLGLAASPVRDFAAHLSQPASLERWEVAGRAVALQYGVPLAIAHLVGTEGGKIFAGGGAVYGPGGQILGKDTLLEPSHLDVELSLEDMRLRRVRSPMLEDVRTMLPHLGDALTRAAPRKSGGAPTLTPSPSPSPASLSETEGASPVPAPAPSWVRPDLPNLLDLNLPLLRKALVRFLQDEVRRRRGIVDVVVGISGGVDSAVTLALAVEAFGAAHVHAFLLPDRASSSESLVHGHLVCEAFGVASRTIEIHPGIEAYIAGEPIPVTAARRGNLAARFRAMVLWDQSARVGGLVLGTGNKSERLLGYFTWHADDSPPVNPLGDLLKTQVWALARELGVPEVVVSKPPSADLVAGVHDEDELGVSYGEADPILHWLLEGIHPDALIARGFRADAVRRVHERLEGTHWKRQLPTQALVSPTAIGGFYLRPVDF
jgi:NAD+ synthase (glutamine-hydrolysing)